MAEMTNQGVNGASPYEDDIRTAARCPLPWQALEGKNVLVTGATGLIGSAVVKMILARTELKCRVFAAGRDRDRAARIFRREREDSRFGFLSFDVVDGIPSQETFHYIINAAGGANPQLYKTDPVGVMRGNIMGADALLRYGVTHGLERMVYVSSGEVYGEGDGREFTEEYSGYVDPTSVRACYPSAKRATETLCISYGQQYGFGVCIARPSHVYGPQFSEGDNRAYAEFVRNVLRGEDIVLRSAGEAFRSWTYAVDCASALLYILLKGESGQAYNIANAESNVSIRTLAETVAALASRRVVFDIPHDSSHGNTTPITRAVFNTDRLEALGWRPLYGLEEGLRHTIQSVRPDE